MTEAEAKAATDEERTASARPPLIVDLDCTLVRSDTLIEGMVAGVFQKPFSLATRLPQALVSVPAFKKWVFENIEVDYEAIPGNDKLLDYLTAEKAQGREVHLVSAAHQGVVDRMDARFGIFDSASGSSPGLNLKGRKKLEHVRERFGDNFVYAGDSKADLAIWKQSGGGIYAGANPGIKRRLERRGDWLEADFSRKPAGPAEWLKALRVHQWSKNLLLFAPLALSHTYGDVHRVVAAVFAWFILGVSASGTYLVNDLVDLAADRRHRTKRHRPLAAASLPIAAGGIASILLIGGGVAAAFFLSPMFALWLLAYLALTLSYSLRLKRTPLLDIFVLASLYTLRILMGSAVIGVPHSLWLLTFSMFFFFSLSLAKRHVEVAAARQEPGVKIRNRGYFPEDAALTLSLGVAGAACSILILVLYLVDEAYGTRLYRSPGYLGGVPIIIAFWTSRIWLLAHRGDLHDDPVAFATRDKVSLMLGVGLVGLLAAAVLL